MNEKTNYYWPVTSENANVYNLFLQKSKGISADLRDKEIIIIGAGIRGCCLLKILESNGFNNFVFVDNNKEKQGNNINEYDIISFEEALNRPTEKVFLVAPEDAGNIYIQLSNAGLKENKDWYSFSFSAYDQYVEEYKRFAENYLLVMGDCAFTHIALDDINFDSLGTMIRNEIGSEKCKVLDMHGMGQQAYYHIAKSLIERNEKPSAFLLLLMIETMAPKVPIMPRTQHPKLIKELVNCCENPNIEFVEYAKLAQQRLDNFQVESFASFDDRNSQVQEKLYMQINYLFKFRENSEGVVYLKKTIRMMNENDIPVILYVPPVNYYQGERLFGDNFKIKYETNFKKLYSILDEENLEYKVMDASYLLDIEDFAAPNTIDETCNYNGRRKIIDFLKKSDLLNKYFAKNDN